MDPTIYKIGFWSGLIAFAASVAYVIVQLLQVISVFNSPMDEILIYGTSLCIVIPFVLEILVLHYATPSEKKFWSHGALIFAVIYAVFVTANYVVQLGTVVPMKLKGVSQEIRILEQTPHSLFWDFDALGYIFMGLATLIAIPVFEKHGFQKWVRISFIANALVTPLITIVYFYPVYSEKLLVLGFPWGITAPLAMLLLALMFKKNYKTRNNINE
ncbi:hypothetical protein FW778_17035 [Ginsengibacter hankyongi]|uniref:Uncharacterized protein n=1 Tax=Ginsengibacter hankyongi TaxID=2607284 RepID=A0A5J5IEB9_9BACT|nr:hypothetical protein [Ginsengibacter hankyongi]KAA9037133.1 hypothetical protein FW778_17035 [Ginsengibacter hankyongi]